MTGRMEQRIDLGAVTFSPCAPTAKVLAVIGQKSVMTLADSGARATDDFFTGIFSLFLKYPDGSAFGEMLKVSYFDRTRQERTAVPGIVGNAVVTKVDTVMDIESALADQMRSDRQ